MATNDISAAMYDRQPQLRGPLCPPPDAVAGVGGRSASEGRPLLFGCARFRGNWIAGIAL